METKISKAQQEVWAWKEKAYNQIKQLAKADQIPFILQQTKEIADKIRAAKTLVVK